MDFNRLKKTFVWIAANEYKGTIRTMVGLTLGLTFLYCIQLGLDLNIYMGETWEQSKMTYVWTNTLVVFSIFLVFSIAYIAKDLRTNDGRVMTLMLPANNIEKYLARFVWITISSVVTCIVAFVCADILRILLSYAFGWIIHSSLVWNVVSNGFYYSPSFEDNIPYLVVLQVFLMPLWVHSFYTLGGTFFRRQPLLLTTVTLFALTTLFGIIMGTVATHMPSSCMEMFGRWLGANIESGNELPMLIIIVPTLAFIIFNYWASYKLYCRIQVISNKWINI